MGLRLITPPAYSPITLAQALAHLRVDAGDDDAYVALALASAVSAVESFTKRPLYKQQWRYALNQFPYGRTGFDDFRPLWMEAGAIELPLAPLVATNPITSIAYVDEAGAAQTLGSSHYRVSNSDRCVVAPTYGEVWPVTLAVQDAVTIDFYAGYAEDTTGGDTANVIPPALKHAVLLMLGQFYANREAVITGTIAVELPLGVQSLCAPFAKVTF